MDDESDERFHYYYYYYYYYEGWADESPQTYTCSLARLSRPPSIPGPSSSTDMTSSRPSFVPAWLGLAVRRSARVVEL